MLLCEEGGTVKAGSGCAGSIRQPKPPLGVLTYFRVCAIFAQTPTQRTYLLPGAVPFSAIFVLTCFWCCVIFGDLRTYLLRENGAEMNSTVLRKQKKMVFVGRSRGDRPASPKNPRPGTFCARLEAISCGIGRKLEPLDRLNDSLRTCRRTTLHVL